MEKFKITDEMLKEGLTPTQYEYFKKENVTYQETDITLLPDPRTIGPFVNFCIKALRKYYGLTQQEIANVLGIHQQEYSRLEKDGYNILTSKITSLAIFYNVSLDTIFGLTQGEVKPLFKDDDVEGCINGYILSQMLEAKAKGEKYIPIDEEHLQEQKQK